MSQTRIQKHFTILEVASDWHELTIEVSHLWPYNSCSGVYVLQSRWKDPPHPPGRGEGGSRMLRGLMLCTKKNFLVFLMFSKYL